MKAETARRRYNRRRGCGAFLILLSFVICCGCHSTPPWEIQLKRAGELFHQGKIQEAVPAYEEILQRWPESPVAPQALFELGRIYNHYLENFPRAIISYTRLLSEYPQSSYRYDARQELGQIYADIYKDFPRAIKQYLKIIADSPHKAQRAESYHHLGQCYFQMEDYKNAFLVYQTILQDYSDSEYRDLAFYNVCRIYQLGGKTSEAAAALKKFIAEHPESPLILDANLALADCYENMHRYLDAMRTLQAIKNPGDKKEIIEYKKEKIRTRLRELP